MSVTHVKSIKAHLIRSVYIRVKLFVGLFEALNNAVQAVKELLLHNVHVVGELGHL